MSGHDDSFFAPPRPGRGTAASSSSRPAAAAAAAPAASSSSSQFSHSQSPARARARQLFGLPSDPTRHHAPSQFDDYDSFEASSYLGTAYAIADDEEYMNHHLHHHGAVVDEEQLDEEDEDPEEEDEDDLMDDHDYDDNDDEDYHDERAADDELGGELAYDADNTGAGGDDGDQADTTYLESETSSAAFDPDDDPVGWGERLDELAGVLEMSEEEARAIRWGPAIGRNVRDAPDLNMDSFRKLLNHHLSATEWRFDPSVQAASLTPNPELHPIRVLGRGWIGRAAGERLEPVIGVRQIALDNGYGQMV